MEIVKLTTAVNATERLHIDIPARLSPGKVQAVPVPQPYGGGCGMSGELQISLTFFQD